MTERTLPYTAEDLGFAALDAGEWFKECRGVPARFRVLRTLDELAPVEALQLDVFGMTERDLVSASELVVVPETGGEVFGAFVREDRDETIAGCLIGWGGFVNGRGRVVSDFLAVEPRFRNLGLGGELKRLQAAVALARGFSEIVWTVDPLRAANARLNFGKLGATCRHYERNRYGDEFGVGLYGGMPTDRLHLDWEIGSGRVRRRLLDGEADLDPAEAAALPAWEPDLPAGRALLHLPSDIDALLAEAPAAASQWRFLLREQLETAFQDGWVITGFVPGADPLENLAAYVLERADREGAP